MRHIFNLRTLGKVLVLSGVSALLWACKSAVVTPEDTKFLEDFHRTNFESVTQPLDENQLNLFIDYSTCNKLGQHSRFFQEVSASLVNKTTAYYSIKGSEIQQEDLSAGGVYSLLRNIEEVNYAELEKAAQMMADGTSESVLITDGEYYTPSIAKGHDNDPYLAGAFKKWILKDHDIHIISEPYVEPYYGKNYAKKRFYIIFSDDRMPNNIYDRIRRTVNFEQFPEVDEFHISASHPRLHGEGNNASVQNEILESKAKGFGTFEIEDWDGCDWKTIEDMIVNAVNDETGEAIPNGESIISLSLDKNSFGCYRIKSVDLKVYDINEPYAEYYEARANGEKRGVKAGELSEVENFMLIDPTEFDKHSKIDIHFNADWFNPNVLTGNPYNYLKADVLLGEVQPTFDQHEEKFEFESISQAGEKNVSVASSIKQCLADDEILEHLAGQVIYSIYIKSEAK